MFVLSTEWDAFYRLRKIKNRSTSDLVAEYKYNGLGYRISIHEDTDDDSDVDASDKWFHHAFDERWRWVATFREDDSDPKEEYLHHAAGLDGNGTGSYIDLVILRDRDINSGWTSAADGTLEERIYYCQNWRADVSALVDDSGQMLEWVKYSAYGVPFGLPGGDTDSDGDCDGTDVSQVYTWEEGTTYDVRGDIDLDGDVDSTDASTISSDYSGITLGRGELSTESLSSRIGLEGTEVLGYSQLTNDRRNTRNADLGVALHRQQEKDVCMSGAAPNMYYFNTVEMEAADQRSLCAIMPCQAESACRTGDARSVPCVSPPEVYFEYNPCETMIDSFDECLCLAWAARFYACHNCDNAYEKCMEPWTQDDDQGHGVPLMFHIPTIPGRLYCSFKRDGCYDKEQLRFECAVDDCFREFRPNDPPPYYPSGNKKCEQFN